MEVSSYQDSFGASGAWAAMDFVVIIKGLLISLGMASSSLKMILVTI